MAFAIAVNPLKLLFWAVVIIYIITHKRSIGAMITVFLLVFFWVFVCLFTASHF